jgi:hypothetical protein
MSILHLLHCDCIYIVILFLEDSELKLLFESHRLLYKPLRAHWIKIRCWNEDEWKAQGRPNNIQYLYDCTSLDVLPHSLRTLYYREPHDVNQITHIEPKSLPPHLPPHLTSLDFRDGYSDDTFVPGTLPDSLTNLFIAIKFNNRGHR